MREFMVFGGLHETGALGRLEIPCLPVMHYRAVLVMTTLADTAIDLHFNNKRRLIEDFS
jgi:hypothetical protein